MTSGAPLQLLGAFGSPYTRKMLALLRYRHIPYRLHWGSAHNPPPGLPKTKVALLPTLYFPLPDGSVEAAVDSTPLIRRLERGQAARSVIPADPVLAFLAYVVEDFADEWLTKAMFHYRWHYAADADQAGTLIPLWVDPTLTAEALAGFKQAFATRQIGRLGVVGSNATTAPLIEASYVRVLELLDGALREGFLFGRRPSCADFAVYGQLARLGGLLGEIGRVYVPYLSASAAALAAGEAQFSARIDGHDWTQQSFAYQGKCLGWIAEQFAALEAPAREAAAAALRAGGCADLVEGAAA